jgi:hypothetical protein
VIVALPVRPVAFVAVAVAVFVAGFGRVFLAGLPRWAVVVVSGRPAVVPVPLTRALVVAVVACMARGVLAVVCVARRYVVPVTDGAAARRGMKLLARLSGW